MGREREGELLLIKALAIRRKYCGNDHLDVGFALDHLGNCLKRQGRLQEAEKVLTDALRIRQRGFGPAHIATLSTVTQLATVLEEEGKLGAAEGLLDQATPPDVATQSTGSGLLLVRGSLHARLGRFKEASADLSRAIELEPEVHTGWFWLAPLLANGAEIEAYREHCRKSLELFGKTSDPIIAERTAKFCLILPASGVDPETIGKIVDVALSAATNHSAISWLRNAKGLAEYRCGHFASAAGWMQQVLCDAGRELNRDAMATMVMAMAQQQLKHTEEARATLASGLELVEKKLPTLDSGDLGKDWYDWIFARLLMGEAKALIQGPSTPAKE